MFFFSNLGITSSGKSTLDSISASKLIPKSLILLYFLFNPPEKLIIEFLKDAAESAFIISDIASAFNKSILSFMYAL